MKKPALYKSFQFTFQGLFYLLRNERNFKIHVAALLINLALIFLLNISMIDSTIIIGACFLVLITEAVNTSIEKICDYIQPNFDPKIGVIKDIAGAAVLLSAIAAVIIGIIIYWQPVFNIIQNI